VYIWANINRPHPLSTHADANSVSKNHYSHMQMRIAVFKHASFIYNFYLYMINSPKRRCFGVKYQNDVVLA
jgi:hypothetical protein